MTQQPQDQAMLVYRVEMLERRVQQLQSAKESEVQLSIITRMIEDVKEEQKRQKDQLETLDNKLGEHKDALAKLQIRVLTYVLVTCCGTAVTIFAGVIVAYATHLIH